MKKTCILFSSALLLALWACAAAAQGAAGRVSFTTYRLASGLRVVLAPDARDAAVAVNLSFDAGTRAEGAGQAGAARVLQRVALAEVLGGGAGGEGRAAFEGVVNAERASYFTEVDAGRLDAVLSALARVMRAPDVSRARVDDELNVLADECGRLDERRFGRAEEALLRVIYGDSAHRHGALCRADGSSRLTPARLRSFHAARYAPHAAVLVVVGNFREAEARGLVAKYFGALPRAAARTRVPREAARAPLGRRETIPDSRPRPPVYLSAYLTVPSDHRDWYALNILADIVGQGEASRLHRALVARGLATSVPEGVAESRGPSLFRIGVALAPGAAVGEVEAVVDAELARLRGELVTPAELALARRQEREYSAGQLRTPAGRASFLARSTLYYDDPRRINTELGRLLAVTAADVRRVARKYLVEAKRAVVVTRPAAAR